MRTGRAHRFAVVFWVLACLSCDLAAQEQESHEEFTARITRDLTERNAGAAEIFVQANAAVDSGDLATAEQLYRQVREIEPDFDHATRRLCGVVARQLGRRSEALSLCREALHLDSSLVNRAALTQVLVVIQPATPSPDELMEAYSHAQVLLNDPGAGEYELTAACMAVAVNDAVEMLRNCSERLSRISENPDVTYFVAWMLKMLEGDHDGAELLLQQARAEGMAPEVYEDLLQATRDARPIWPGIARLAGIVGGVWLAGLLLLLGAGAVLSQLTLRLAQLHPAAANRESVGGDAALRRVYRAVLWLCCAYYY
ncbi:MAG: tetratricopeptide repeat protein, partial [Gemmatimonadota bacterium]|nr:tetratricopeptide repeat protein [Gemmatimonadota bacterium]